MIIMRFSGALGNQLFQYALYYKLKKIGKKVKADLSLFEKGIEKRHYYLSELGIQVEKATEDEIKKYATSNSTIQKILVQIRVKRPFYKDHPVYTYQPRVFDFDTVFLDGYWQCPGYFEDIRVELLKNIIFPKMRQSNLIMKQQIEDTNSISIHIRMGDYLSNSDLYGGICTVEYYREAIQYMREKVQNPTFYIFSDEPNRAREVLNDSDMVLVEGNDEDQAYCDLELMSHCKYNIIANSSFSWWAAWINQNKQKIVISPSKWLNGYDNCDIWSKDWIRI